MTNRKRWAVMLALLVAPALFAGEETVYGEGVGETETVAIGELLAHPDQYVDKRIRVDGNVADVCPKMGCWIEIATRDGEQTVRFKVKDGEIEFPVEAKGKSVAAEGIFTKVEMTREKALAWAEHLAEEKGEPFDSETWDGPLAHYQINGKGAVIR